MHLKPINDMILATKVKLVADKSNPQKQPNYCLVNASSAYDIRPGDILMYEDCISRKYQFREKDYVLLEANEVLAKIESDQEIDITPTE